MLKSRRPKAHIKLWQTLPDADCRMILGIRQGHAHPREAAWVPGPSTVRSS